MLTQRAYYTGQATILVLLSSSRFATGSVQFQLTFGDLV